jgi:DNA-binding NtrC family response regulator
MTRRCRLLIVEDNNELESLLRHALSLEGYEVSIVGTTSTALDQINLTGYDIVIVDVTSASGADAVALQAKAQGIGVILVSGNPVHMEDMESACHAFLMKPFRLSAISELVLQTLEQTKAECERPPRSSMQVVA